METKPRHALVQVRVTVGERERWRRAAVAEELRLVELVREAVRAHVRELERLRLLGGRGSIAAAPSAP
jgi:hypothetical protein